MFEGELKVKLRCDGHPRFDPAVSAPTKRCDCCRAIANVYEWLRMANRTATRVNEKYYSSIVTPDVLTESNIAYTVQEPVNVIEDTPVKKEKKGKSNAKEILDAESSTKQKRRKGNIDIPVATSTNPMVSGTSKNVTKTRRRIKLSR